MAAEQMKLFLSAGDVKAAGGYDDYFGIVFPDLVPAKTDAVTAGIAQHVDAPCLRDLERDPVTAIVHRLYPFEEQDTLKRHFVLPERIQYTTGPFLQAGQIGIGSLLLSQGLCDGDSRTIDILQVIRRKRDDLRTLWEFCDSGRGAFGIDLADLTGVLCED